MRTAFLLLVFAATALQGWAQNAENRQISLEMKNEPLGSALKQFSNVSGYKVNFPSEDVAPYRVTVSIYQMSPFAALQKILEGKPFEYDVKQNFITVRKVKATSTTASGKFRNVGGQVVDEGGNPLPRETLFVKFRWMYIHWKCLSSVCSRKRFLLKTVTMSG